MPNIYEIIGFHDMQNENKLANGKKERKINKLNANEKTNCSSVTSY